MHLITCGRFSNNIDLSQAKNEIPKKIRISSTNPNRISPVKYEPLATDGEVVVYKARVLSIEEFIVNMTGKSDEDIIVLTWREFEIMQDMVSERYLDLKIAVLEEKYPIFDSIKYTPNAKKKLP